MRGYVEVPRGTSLRSFGSQSTASGRRDIVSMEQTRTNRRFRSLLGAQLDRILNNVPAKHFRFSQSDRGKIGTFPIEQLVGYQQTMRDAKRNFLLAGRRSRKDCHLQRCPDGFASVGKASRHEQEGRPGRTPLPHRGPTLGAAGFLRAE